MPSSFRAAAAECKRAGQMSNSSLCTGEGLVISPKGPGLFLQGLAVHGKDGTLLEGQLLPLTKR